MFISVKENYNNFIQQILLQTISLILCYAIKKTFSHRLKLSLKMNILTKHLIYFKIISNKQKYQTFF